MGLFDRPVFNGIGNQQPSAQSTQGGVQVPRPRDVVNNTAKIQNIDRRLTSLETKINQSISQAGNVQNINSQINSINSKLGNLINKQNVDSTNLRNSIAGNLSIIRNIESQVQSNKTSAQQNSQTLSSIVGDITKAKSDITNISGRLTSLINSVSPFGQSISRNASLIQTANSGISLNGSRISQATGRISALETSFGPLGSRITALEGSIGSLNIAGIKNKISGKTAVSGIFAVLKTDIDARLNQLLSDRNSAAGFKNSLSNISTSLNVAVTSVVTAASSIVAARARSPTAIIGVIPSVETAFRDSAVALTQINSLVIKLLDFMDSTLNWMDHGRGAFGDIGSRAATLSTRFTELAQLF